MATNLTVAQYRALLTRWGVPFKARDVKATLATLAYGRMERTAYRYGPPNRASLAQRRAVRKAQRRMLRDIASVKA